MDCSLPGSSVHGILQIRILEWVAIPFSRGSSWPRGLTCVSCLAGRFFTIWGKKPRFCLLVTLEYFFPSICASQLTSLPTYPPQCCCLFFKYYMIMSLYVPLFTQKMVQWLPMAYTLDSKHIGWPCAPLVYIELSQLSLLFPHPLYLKSPLPEVPSSL